MQQLGVSGVVVGSHWSNEIDFNFFVCGQLWPYVIFSVGVMNECNGQVTFSEICLDNFIKDCVFIQS